VISANKNPKTMMARKKGTNMIETAERMLINMVSFENPKSKIGHTTDRTHCALFKQSSIRLRLLRFPPRQPNQKERRPEVWPRPKLSFHPFKAAGPYNHDANSQTIPPSLFVLPSSSTGIFSLESEVSLRKVVSGYTHDIPYARECISRRKSNI